MGISTCIASDLQDYVATATRLAMDAAERDAAAAEIEQTRGAVFEDERIIADLESWMTATVDEARDFMG